jgi:hypothetical protein
MVRWAPWLISIILATWEAEIWRMAVQSHPRQKSSKDRISTSKNWAYWYIPVGIVNRRIVAEANFSLNSEIPSPPLWKKKKKNCLVLIKRHWSRCAHTCNPNTQEAEVEWLQIWGQPRLHKEKSCLKKHWMNEWMQGWGTFWWVRCVSFVTFILAYFLFLLSVFQVAEIK